MKDTMDSGSAHPDQAQGVISLHDQLPGKMETGTGQFLVVSGECRAPDDRVLTVSVGVNGTSEQAELSESPQGVSFWEALFLPQEAAGRTVAVNVNVRLASGRSLDHVAGRIACRDVNWRPTVSKHPPGKGLVSICMATYNPELHAFKRQVDSIRAQIYENWICIVNDDGTAEESWRQMREYCADDERFVFFRNPDNLGFYRNFERLLTRVPEDAEYVAYSDQDDYWYPDKLSRLVERIQADDAMLVYSDMRIVDTDGNPLAGTYWVNRKNEYRDFKVVLVANTVTGAASLFKRDILRYMVPFPPRVGDAFHDHWLACVAMSMGRITYVDAPLYDYYQHGTSVIGHCDFVRFTLQQRITSLLRFCYRMCRPDIARPLLKKKYTSALAVYRGECRRLRLVEKTIRQRCPIDARMDRNLRLFEGGLRSMMKLLWLHLMVLLRKQTTDDAELRLAFGEAARLVEQYRMK